MQEALEAWRHSSFGFDTHSYELFIALPRYGVEFHTYSLENWVKRVEWNILTRGFTYFARYNSKLKQNEKKKKTISKLKICVKNIETTKNR